MNDDIIGMFAADQKTGGRVRCGLEGRDGSCLRAGVPDGGAFAFGLKDNHMKRALGFCTCLLLAALCGCVSHSTKWDYPYPAVRDGKPPEERASFKDGMFRHDAVEHDPRYKFIFEKIDSEVDEAVKNHPLKDTFGFGHTWNGVKRRILYWKYGIDWCSPATMTPEIIVD